MIASGAFARWLEEDRELKAAVSRVVMDDPHLKRAIAAFTDRVMHAATVNGLEELGLVRVMSGSEAEKLREGARGEARAGGHGVIWRDPLSPEPPPADRPEHIGGGKLWMRRPDGSLRHPTGRELEEHGHHGVAPVDVAPSETRGGRTPPLVLVGRAAVRSR